MILDVLGVIQHPAAHVDEAALGWRLCNDPPVTVEVADDHDPVFEIATTEVFVAVFPRGDSACTVDVEVGRGRVLPMEHSIGLRVGEVGEVLVADAGQRDRPNLDPLYSELDEAVALEVVSSPLLVKFKVRADRWPTMPPRPP